MTDRFAAGSSGEGGKGLPSLLIADDDPVVLSMISTQLAGSFEIVASARDAEEAIVRAVEHQPDVAIIDVQMPAGGGLRVVQALHELAPATAVVALSGDESDSMVRAIIGAGAVTYVRKGIRSDELVATVYRSIKTHAQLGERQNDAARSASATNRVRTHS